MVALFALDDLYVRTCKTTAKKIRCTSSSKISYRTIACVTETTKRSASAVANFIIFSASSQKPRAIEWSRANTSKYIRPLWRKATCVGARAWVCRSCDSSYAHASSFTFDLSIPASEAKATCTTSNGDRVWLWVRGRSAEGPSLRVFSLSVCASTPLSSRLLWQSLLPDVSWGSQSWEESVPTL